MKLVVGLGNPGAKYEGTRHNIGFEVLAELTRRWPSPAPKTKFEGLVWDVVANSRKFMAIAPQTYMNLSGRSVQAAAKFFQIPAEDILVVCDDMDLPTGQLRLRGSGSAGGQKGLMSILQCLGTQSVARLRMGVGRPPENVASADYVLGRFAKSEAAAVEESVQRAASAVEVWLTNGLATAMNQYNVAPPSNL